MNIWNIKPSTTKELAALYAVTPKVFRRWLIPFKNEIGRRVGTYFTAKQVEIIINKLGLPPDYEVHCSRYIV